MIALALLFIVIIGLLSVIVWLLQKYFEMYSNLHTSEDSQMTEVLSRFSIRQKQAETLGSEEQINAVINERLMEMERKFPSHPTQEELSEQFPEVLTNNFKQTLRATLNLLKTKPQDDSF